MSQLFNGLRKERKQQGVNDRASGLSPRYPQDGYYMKGYNQKETVKKILKANSPFCPANAEAQAINFVKA